MIRMDTYTVGGREIPVSHRDKVLFPDAGVTKGDLFEYYDRIADTLLPHAADRPISMERYPDGIASEGFYQKEVPDYFPDWIRRATVNVKEAGTQEQVVCDDAATLVYLADQGCITPHIWLSRADRLEYPDKIIFDLDPPDGGFEVVREAASLLHERLEDASLAPHVMTTGSRGLHVVAPIERRYRFDTVREFAGDIACDLSREHPDTLTTEVRKNRRKGRLFLDTLRNAYGQTSVTPYAVRTRPGAPVATPLRWDELEDADLHSQTYTTKNIFRRLGQVDDPWRHFSDSAGRLPSGGGK